MEHHFVDAMGSYILFWPMRSTALALHMDCLAARYLSQSKWNSLKLFGLQVELTLLWFHTDIIVTWISAVVKWKAWQSLANSQI